MRIKEILSQHRRDFRAVYECEHCGDTKESSGYDDDNFHNNVIPSWKCKSCGKSAATEYRPLKPKHEAHEIL